MDVWKMVNEKMSIETLNQLITLINKYETNTHKSRKIKESDLSSINNSVHIEKNNTKEYIKSFRMQTEYGPKKFIKP